MYLSMVFKLFYYEDEACQVLLVWFSDVCPYLCRGDSTGVFLWTSLDGTAIRQGPLGFDPFLWKKSGVNRARCARQVLLCFASI